MTAQDAVPPAGYRPPRRRRWQRVLVALVAALVFLVVGVGPWWLVDRLTRGRFNYNDRENAGLTPKSFDLPFEEVGFASSDGVALSGWWVPARDAKGTAVLVHGLNRARIEMVRKTPFLHGSGWNVLLFDLRCHGASGGERRSLGWLERHDVRAAVAEARRRFDGPVVVWGVSLGAASAMFAAAEDGGVAGVVSDSSYRSLEDTVGHHFGRVREMRPWLRVFPSRLLAAECLFWLRRGLGFDTAEADVRRAAARIARRPALFVANAGDWRMPTDIAFELKAAAGPRARVLVVPGQKHGSAYRDATSAYESAVRQLLDEVLISSSLLRQGRISGGRE